MDSPSGSLAVPVRATVSPTSTVIWSPDAVTTGARLPRIVTLTDAEPVRDSSGSVAVSVNTISRSLSAGPGAVQLVDCRRGRAEAADVRVGRPLEAQRVGYGVGVCGLSAQGDGAIGVYYVGVCGHAGDDGRGVLIIINGKGYRSVCQPKDMRSQRRDVSSNR